ncbi:MAG: hypothetical protein ABSG98_04420 [Anaerolineales bacterium]|jgi:hypothetical protein
MITRSHFKALPLVIVVAATLIVALIWFQGWRERLLNDLDKIILYQQAYSLVRNGQIPNHGEVYSYGSYGPPGVAYLVAPGMLIAADPRLYEIPLTVALYLGAVMLAYFLGRSVGGVWVGLVSALALAVSRLGQPDLDLTQFFVVATMLLAWLWAVRRQPAALAAAIVSFAAGLYVHPNTLPLGLAIPFLWVAYRPPVNWKGLGLALVVAGAIWFPYLRFEWGRQFLDIRSYVSRRQVVALEGTPVNTPTYCYAALEGESDTQNETYLPYLGLPAIAKRVVSPEPPGIGTLRVTLCSVALKIGRNFNNDTFLFGNNRIVNASLLTVFWAGLIALLSSPILNRARGSAMVERLVAVKIPVLIVLLALGAAAIYLALSPAWLAKCCTADGKLQHPSLLLVEQWQSLLPLVWVSLVLGLFLAAHAGEDWKGLGALGILGLVPFVILVGVSETARADRFWWIWPAQLIVVVITIGLFAEQTPWPRAVFAGLSTVLVILMINAPFYQGKIGDWLTNGYEGKSSGQVETVDYLGQIPRASGSTTMTIGYELQAPVFTTETSVDPSYRTGSWFDFLLETREEIRNLNDTVEGLTNKDEFRVLEIGDGPTVAESPWRGFQFIERFGRFEVFRRE